MKVCVIGAGPAGLTTIKQLLDEEHEVVCFERQASVGGIWYRHDADADETKAYDDIILTISMKLMSFSDFIYKGERKFETRKGYLRYLQAYADKFALTERIRFNSAVKRVRKDGDRWLVTVEREGVSSEHEFGAVALCTGPFRTPNMTSSAVEQLDNFSGEVIHSSRYRNNSKFRDKKVLVVGLAESGADLLREISDVSAKCTLSVRSHTFLLPRLPDGKHATDNITVRAHHYELYVRASEIPFPTMAAIFEDEDCSRQRFLEASQLYGMMFLAQQALRMTAGAGNTETTDATNPLGGPARPLQLDVDTELTQEAIDFINDWNRKSHNGESTYSPKIIFCKNVSFVPNILNGKVRVDDTGIAGIQGKSVRFQGGATEDFDVIVLCTGFKNDFSVFENVEITDGNVRNLYKHAFHPEHTGLAVIGICRPFTGGIPICAEMQARYFALLCNGKLELPADVDERIKREKDWEERWTEYSPRCFDAIPSQIFFCDSIAAEIGCLPTASQLISAPELFVKLWFNSFNQTAYRLVGPHSMPDEARQELMKVELPMGSLGFVAGMLSLLGAPTSDHPEHNHFEAPSGTLPPKALGALENALRSTARLAVNRSKA